MEGVPGLAKTLTVKTLATAITAASGASSSPPIWCLPIWWAPASITLALALQHHAGPGVRQPVAGRRDQPGAGRCRAHCLEVMQERQVTIAGET